ncbi:hypothetical protein AYI70_g3815 [Smittium culicis]|uniref:Uncharacterized protein n=1 Tax=Smittium culicis TaxID=133412 RepID=A0A1R1Y1P3_9FUNG|nr:hypothetical protein AYI70_g3815 [Smittium culicis]
MIWIFSNIWSAKIVEEEYSEFPKLINKYVSKYCETSLDALPRVFGPNSKKDKKFKQAVENYMNSGLDKINYFGLSNIFK